MNGLSFSLGQLAVFVAPGIERLAVVIVPAVLGCSVVLAVGVGRLALRGMFHLLGQTERQAAARTAAPLESDSTGHIPL